jgi:hypothetical protein
MSWENLLINYNGMIRQNGSQKVESKKNMLFDSKLVESAELLEKSYHVGWSSDSSLRKI